MWIAGGWWWCSRWRWPPPSGCADRRCSGPGWPRRSRLVPRYWCCSAVPAPAGCLHCCSPCWRCSRFAQRSPLARSTASGPRNVSAGSRPTVTASAANSGGRSVAPAGSPGLPTRHPRWTGLPPSARSTPRFRRAAPRWRSPSWTSPVRHGPGRDAIGSCHDRPVIRWRCGSPETTCYWRPAATRKPAPRWRACSYGRTPLSLIATGASRPVLGAPPRSVSWFIPRAPTFATTPMFSITPNPPPPATACCSASSRSRRRRQRRAPGCSSGEAGWPSRWLLQRCWRRWPSPDYQGPERYSLPASSGWQPAHPRECYWGFPNLPARPSCARPFSAPSRNLPVPLL